MEIKELAKILNKRDRKEIRKLKKEFTSIIDFKLLSTIPITKDTKIVCDKNYIVLTYSFDKTDKWYRTNRRSYTLLIGKNDDNKFFSNKISPWTFVRQIHKFYFDKSLTETIKQALNYEHDYSSYIFLERKTISDQYIIRVQGDLVFELSLINFYTLEGRYIASISRNIFEQIHITLRNLLLEHLSSELSRLRISNNLVRNHIIIPTTPFSWEIWRKIDEYFRDEINKIVMDKLNEIRSKLGLKRIPLKEYLALNSNYIAYVVNYHNFLEVGISENFFAKTVEDIYKKYYNKIPETYLKKYLKEIPLTLNIGNHTIKCHAYPHRLSFILENVITKEKMYIRTQMEDNIIYTTNKVTILHDEHPKREIRFVFPEDSIPRITVRSLTEYMANTTNRNHIAIKELCNIKRRRKSWDIKKATVQ